MHLLYHLLLPTPEKSEDSNSCTCIWLKFCIFFFCLSKTDKWSQNVCFVDAKKLKACLCCLSLVFLFSVGLFYAFSVFLNAGMELDNTSESNVIWCFSLKLTGIKLNWEVSSWWPLCSLRLSSSEYSWISKIWRFYKEELANSLIA